MKPNPRLSSPGLALGIFYKKILKQLAISDENDEV